MKYTLAGKKVISFTAQDGKTIDGTTLYVTNKMDGVEGQATDKFFVPAEKMPKKDLVVGADVEIYFNRFGKVDTIG